MLETTYTNKKKKTLLEFVTNNLKNANTSKLS